MKCCILFCLLIPLISTAQLSPVSWQLASKKILQGQYEIQIKATLQPSWYIYASNNKEDGIDPPSLHWDIDNIVLETDLKSLIEPIKQKDLIFKKNISVYKNEATFIQNIKISGTIPGSTRVILTAYAANANEFLPLSDTLTVNFEGGIDKDFSSQILLTKMDLKNPISYCGEQQRDNQRLLGTFLLGFIGGLIALFTPCVFPMIPVTVSFFTGKSKTKQAAVKNGLWYGTSIFLIYLLASIPFHFLENIDPQIFNSISTNAWVNVFFFAVFIMFALSFFGLFEITLPSFISNLAGSKSKLGSASGIFFMGLTLAIVSFSCTGPILGSLLVGTLSSNGAWQLTLGMAGFGIALGLPFGLFAMFPQWMQRLPKSGSWMDVVKKSLAFIELALAIKFLSNADLVEHWGILKREVFIGLWIIISFLLSLYLLGTFERKKQLNLPVLTVVRDKRKLSFPPARFFLGVLTLLFTLYLIPGITQTPYANLKLLSGFPPPLSYSIYGKNNVHGKGLEPDVINDYEKAVKLAKEQNKPLLIDFTGWACVNCRKMEEQVWTVPEISRIIKEKYILVSLYVDDRAKLPTENRFIYKTKEGKEKYINTLGDKWATFQSENFAQVTQPLYVILSPDEKLMNNPVGYTPSLSEYKQWLECGAEAFINSQKKKAE